MLFSPMRWGLFFYKKNVIVIVSSLSVKKCQIFQRVLQEKKMPKMWAVEILFIRLFNQLDCDLYVFFVARFIAAHYAKFR